MQQDQQKVTFLHRRFIKPLCYSWYGLKAAWLSEEAFRVEILASAILIPSAFFIGQSPVESTLLIASILLILIVELLNTALEKAVDRISSEAHPLSKTVKDLGSAAVLISISVAIFVWGYLLISR